jgi:hypothetical protein
MCRPLCRLCLRAKVLHGCSYFFELAVRRRELCLKHTPPLCLLGDARSRPLPVLVQQVYRLGQGNVMQLHLAVTPGALRCAHGEPGALRCAHGELVRKQSADGTALDVALQVPSWIDKISEARSAAAPDRPLVQGALVSSYTAPGETARCRQQGPIRLRHSDSLGL